MKYLLSINERYGPNAINAVYVNAKRESGENAEMIKDILRDYEEVSQGNFTTAHENCAWLTTPTKGLTVFREDKENPSDSRLLKLFLGKKSFPVGVMTTDGYENTNFDMSSEMKVIGDYPDGTRPPWFGQAKYCLVVDLDMTYVESYGTRDHIRYKREREKSTPQKPLTKHIRTLVDRHGGTRLIAWIMGLKGSLPYALLSHHLDVLLKYIDDRDYDIIKDRESKMSWGVNLRYAVNNAKSGIQKEIIENIETADNLFRDMVRTTYQRDRDAMEVLINRIMAVSRLAIPGSGIVSPNLMQLLAALSFTEGTDTERKNLIQKRLRELEPYDLDYSRRLLANVKEFCRI
jgi:hypothetical protein